jgi:hypothetical protein
VKKKQTINSLHHTQKDDQPIFLQMANSQVSNSSGIPSFMKMTTK